METKVQTTTWAIIEEHLMVMGASLLHKPETAVARRFHIVPSVTGPEGTVQWIVSRAEEVSAEHNLVLGLVKAEHRDPRFQDATAEFHSYGAEEPHRLLFYLRQVFQNKEEAVKVLADKLKTVRALLKEEDLPKPNDGEKG